MRKIRMLALLSAVWLVPAIAHAQFDHLTCFKAKDSQKFAATADFLAAQPAFTATGCKISGKSAFFCAPAAKILGDYTVDKVPAVPLPVPGTTPLPDTICYKVKCATATPPTTEDVVDQFGSRSLSKFKVSMVCSPAFKTAPTCELPDPPQCPFNDPCTAGICSTTRGACSQQADCPLAPNEQCCCNGICI
jgi:hypothetical protein